MLRAEPPTGAAEHEQHRARIKDAIRALDKQSKTQAAMSSDAAILYEVRAANRTRHIHRATRRLEEAQQNEPDAEIALETAQKIGRIAKEKENNETQVTFTFDDSGTATPPFQPLSFQSPFGCQARKAILPHVLAQLQTNQVQLQQGLMQLMASMTAIQTALQYILHVDPVAAPVSEAAAASAAATEEVTGMPVHMGRG
ncbi:unnamed protein product, partial [Prorocentrum cordatum]